VAGSCEHAGYVLGFVYKVLLAQQSEHLIYYWNKEPSSVANLTEEIKVDVIALNVSGPWGMTIKGN
jgi:hypothetical protein